MRAALVVAVFGLAACQQYPAFGVVHDPHATAIEARAEQTRRGIGRVWTTKCETNDVTLQEECAVASPVYFNSERDQGWLLVAFARSADTNFEWVGPAVVSPHDWPTDDRVATLRVDENQPVRLDEPLGPQHIDLIEQMMDGQTVRGEYYEWPHRTPAVRMQFPLAGFDEAYSQLVDEVRRRSTSG